MTRKIEIMDLQNGLSVIKGADKKDIDQIGIKTFDCAGVLVVKTESVSNELIASLVKK
jgi:hypothetical protein